MFSPPRKQFILGMRMQRTHLHQATYLARLWTTSSKLANSSGLGIVVPNMS